MKKLKNIIMSLAIILTTLSLTGCQNKKALNSNEFKTKMEAKNYTVIDVKQQFSDYDYIKEAYIATKDNYQIEFYELENEDYAKNFYENNKTIFEQSKENNSAFTHVSLKNYSKYTLKTGGKYKVVSRIDNTVIYLNVDETKTKTVKEILKTIGY